MTIDSVKKMKDALCEKLKVSFGSTVEEASDAQMMRASALVLRDVMAERSVDTMRETREEHRRQVHYLSMEFLMGRSLMKNAFNLGVGEILTEALDELGFRAADIFESEPDAGLGNGGLGRLAACYLDSMTTLDIPAAGYSICYELGIFHQRIVDGQQVELPDNWKDLGGAWLLPKPQETETVCFGGTVRQFWDDGRLHVVPEGATEVLAIPCDMEIAGYGTDHVNTLRLWDAKSPTPLDMSLFSQGEYLRAQEQHAMAETIAKVLYPEDNHPEGKSLRLKQQYFFVSATVQSIVRKHIEVYGTATNFHEKNVIQINDTHPALVIPELMRILIDEYGYDWDTAWSITTKTFNYTCHTLLPEALEVWPASLIGELLPRHLEIIEKINAQFEDELKSKGVDKNTIKDMAIYTGDAVRMAYLATYGGSHVNGVAELHSQLLKDVTLKNFSDVYPDKFTNVTNGVTPRRFVKLANPRLSDLITEGLGTDKWLSDLEMLKGLEPLAKDDEFVKKFAAVKKANKVDFAAYAKREYGFELDPNTMFNTMVKRLHEYKRQSLKILSVISTYADIKSGKVKAEDVTPRTVFFGAKAAPGYYLAKMTIQLINNVSRVVNNDPDVKGKLAVYFPWNYNVRLAQHLIPATDLDEQISQAGKEASGTGNMKFALNGAMTVGTLDGANVEIRERVGAENFFLFGMTVDEVEKKYAEGYNPASYYEADPRLKHAIDMVADGTFSNGDRNAYSPLVADWLTKDWFMTLADFSAYMDIQSEIEALYADELEWNRKALLNVANSGYFSSDRSMEDYLERIWHTAPLAD